MSESKQAIPSKCTAKPTPKATKAPTSKAPTSKTPKAPTSNALTKSSTYDDSHAYGRVIAATEQRKFIFHSTRAKLSSQSKRDAWLKIAMANVQRWNNQKYGGWFQYKVRVYSSDWGVLTQQLTMKRGTIYAVLNMANAYVPGGGYLEGMPAQEENMFRRTDCHFSVSRQKHMNFFAVDGELHERYSKAMTRLINADDGLVYLDTTRPRICLRGPESRDLKSLGYDWLPTDSIFPFFELRSAAPDLRPQHGGPSFETTSLEDMLKQSEASLIQKIDAQLDTLIKHKIRRVVLSAFGCGAFKNPAASVARAYKKALLARIGHFDDVAFAIYNPGYGPADNYTVFSKELDQCKDFANYT